MLIQRGNHDHILPGPPAGTHSHFTAVTKAFGQFQYPTSPLAVLDDLARDAAEKVVQLVPRTRKPLSIVKDTDVPAAARKPRIPPVRKAKGTTNEERTA